MWGFNHEMWDVGHISQEVIPYRSDSMGNGSVDKKVVVYNRGLFGQGSTVSSRLIFLANIVQSMLQNCHCYLFMLISDSF